MSAVTTNTIADSATTRGGICKSVNGVDFRPQQVLTITNVPADIDDCRVTLAAEMVALLEERNPQLKGTVLASEACIKNTILGVTAAVRLGFRGQGRAQQARDAIYAVKDGMRAFIGQVPEKVKWCVADLGKWSLANLIDCCVADAARLVAVNKTVPIALKSADPNPELLQQWKSTVYKLGMILWVDNVDSITAVKVCDWLLLLHNLMLIHFTFVLQMRLLDVNRTVFSQGVSPVMDVYTYIGGEEKLKEVWPVWCEVRSGWLLTCAVCFLCSTCSRSWRRSRSCRT